MRYLIPGGLGFIGYHLCNKLVSEGHDVTVIDNKITNINDIPKDIHYVNCDISNSIFLNYILDRNFDYIINLASPTAPELCKKNPLETLMSNIDGTRNLLDFSLIYNIPFIQISSIRTLENSNPVSPIACYIEGKRTAETLCYEYSKLSSNVKIIRLFSVYGKKMHPNDSRVIPTFIRKALKNEPINIIGGNQLDSFSYVDDVVNYLLSITTHDIKINNPITIGNNEFVTIKTLAGLIKHLTNSKSELVFTESNNDICDRSKILINVECKTSLIDGLVKVIKDEKHEKFL